MTKVFSPPAELYVPPILPDTTGPARGLFRHFQRHERGVNVFLLSDGTVIQDQAAGGINAGTVPYPWNPDNPGGPYATWYDENEVAHTLTLNPYIVKVFYGGHSTVVSDADAATLTAAGYGAYITTTTLDPGTGLLPSSTLLPSP